jgi:hypothetical protein
MEILLRLARNSQRYPKSLMLSGISIPQHSLPVAAGQFAEVWKGKDSSGQPVAVKVLRLYTTSDPIQHFKVELNIDMIIFINSYALRMSFKKHSFGVNFNTPMSSHLCVFIISRTTPEDSALFLRG